MTQSMTGFGKSRVELSSSIINIEIRSLNSKYFDLSVKMPTAFKEKELVLKRFLNEKPKKRQESQVKQRFLIEKP